MERLSINSEEAKLIRDTHALFIGADATSEKSLAAIREMAILSCPTPLIVLLRAMSSRQGASGALLVQQLTDQSDLPSTPVRPNATPENKLTLLSEVVELGIAFILGEPVAYQAEKDGALVQHVFPVRSEQEASSNESSASMLDLHTELVFSSRNPKRPLAADSPDFILLSCLRSDPGHEATTVVVEVEDLCAKIPPPHLSVLRQPRFELRAPYSFTRKLAGDRPWIGPVPLLGQIAMRPTAAFDLACGTRGLDPKAELALQALRETAALPGVIQRIQLQEGDLLVLDNRRCAHGRTPFVAAYDGNDRWIQRIYVRRSLDGMQPLDSARSPRIF